MAWLSCKQRRIIYLIFGWWVNKTSYALLDNSNLQYTKFFLLSGESYVFFKKR